MAKLYFKYGAMGSGKSINLLKDSYNYTERNHNILMFTPCLDNRYEVGKITTRVGLSHDAIVIDKKFNIYQYVLNQKQKISCIFVDEAQFLNEKQVIQLSDIVDLLDIPVMCYGLRTDFQIKFFEGSQALMRYADKIEEIKTICECGAKATISMRFINGKPLIKGNQILIGGNQSYKAVCRRCYKKYTSTDKKTI